MSKQIVRKMILQQASVTNKAEKKRYADKIRIIHRAVALSCPDGNREKLPLKVFLKVNKPTGYWVKVVDTWTPQGPWSSVQMTRIWLNPCHFNVEFPSTGGSTFSKIFTLACISYISCPFASHTENTFSLQHRTTIVLQVKPRMWYLVTCLEK